MWSSKLFWKLFLVYVGLSLTLGIGFLLISSNLQRSEIREQIEVRLQNAATILRSQVAEELVNITDDEKPSQTSSEELQKIVMDLGTQTKTLLTVISAKGDVLADSQRKPTGLPNHAKRPEFVQAAMNDSGTTTRQSLTRKVEMQYYALPVDIGSEKRAFVRAAVGMEEINERVSKARNYLLAFTMVVGMIALAVTYTLVGKVIHPLAELTEHAQAIASGQDKEPVITNGGDEIDVLAQAFNRMQNNLNTRFRQLRENNQQMVTVLGSMSEGIIAVDADENIVLANDASKQLLSFTHEDEVGRPLLEAVRSRPLEKVVRKCLEGGHNVYQEYISGQNRRDLEVSATNLPGQPSPGVVVVLRDMTELRRLENLRHEFVANVSHELKTPLATIKAYAETLRLGAIDDKENNLRFVGRIEEQAERLHQLIMDLLQIARVEAGDFGFEITQVMVDKVIDACVAQHAEAANLKKIQLLIDPHDEMLTVRADEDGVFTILDNLISNAIKYTPSGGRVTVRWKSDGAFVVLEVQDTGIGIAPEHHARVFERFYRVDKARSRELGGTGLGLSIVKHLSQAFGGGVTIHSDVGQGTSFKVQLPLVGDNAPLRDLVTDS